MCFIRGVAWKNWNPAATTQCWIFMIDSDASTYSTWLSVCDRRADRQTDAGAQHIRRNSYALCIRRELKRLTVLFNHYIHHSCCRPLKQPLVVAVIEVTSLWHNVFVCDEEMINTAGVLYSTILPSVDRWHWFNARERYICGNKTKNDCQDGGGNKDIGCTWKTKCQYEEQHKTLGCRACTRVHDNYLVYTLTKWHNRVDRHEYSGNNEIRCQEIEESTRLW